MAVDAEGHDVWLKAVEKNMLGVSGRVVIPDVRFPNEAEFTHRWHGVLVRVDRPGFDNGVSAEHASERHIPHLPANYVVRNTGTVENLKAAIVTFWRSFAEHERSHADATFNAKFSALANMCTESKELGYDMLWQGAPE